MPRARVLKPRPERKRETSYKVGRNTVSHKRRQAPPVALELQRGRVFEEETGVNYRKDIWALRGYLSPPASQDRALLHQNTEDGDCS